MTRIFRNLSEAEKTEYDLIIIGGGIYGAMLSFEASRRGLKPLLLERDDFGEHTSYNSLRIIHGGLRYLQKFDLKRFHESVQERSWFLKNFPGLVRPIACLMPLYGSGLRKSGIFRVALMINHYLSRNRNEGQSPDQFIDSGAVISASRVKEIFPKVDPNELQSGAIWNDAFMPHSQRVLIQVLLWASNLGARVLNYTEAVSLIKIRNTVAGINAYDRETRRFFKYRTKIVVNAAGPWCRNIAIKFDKDNPSLFHPSLAWNVLFDREALSSYALAVSPNRLNSKVYFLVPWEGRIMAGTGHVPWEGSLRHPEPSPEQLQYFINDINSAVPKLNLSGKDVIRVYAGFLPAKEKGSSDLSVREVIFDHSKKGGPKGLYSISGVKFTTSRLVAEKTLRKIFPDLESLTGKAEKYYFPCNKYESQKGVFNYEWLPKDSDTKWKDQLRLIIENESVMHLDDLLIRRTSFFDNPDRTNSFIQTLFPIFDWDEERFKRELDRLSDKINFNELLIK
jgi:glycerol-3-phosphate dehydrogenase